MLCYVFLPQLKGKSSIFNPDLHAFIMMPLFTGFHVVEVDHEADHTSAVT